jgi:signal transduction histidine kinase
MNNLEKKFNSGWERLIAVRASDEEQMRLGRLFNILMLISVAIVMILAAVFLVLAELGLIERWVGFMASTFPFTFIPLSIFCLIAARRGHLRPVFHLYVWANFFAIGLAAWLFDGLYSPAWVLYGWTISIAGIVLAPVYALGMSTAVLVYFFLLVLLAHWGMYEPPFHLGIVGRPIIHSAFVLLMLATTIGLLTFLNMRSLRQALGSLRAEIVERKRAEEEIRQLNEELERKVEEVEQRTKELVAAQEELLRHEKLATLGQVAAAVGQELRNPLGVMNNALYFLKTILTDANETTREYLGILGLEIKVATQIVSDLQDAVQTRPADLQLVSPLELVVESLNRCTITKNIVLRQEVSKSLPLISVDPRQIEQALVNLISNAVEAMSGGGELLIKADSAGKLVRMRVSDTGTGIAPENMANLFKPLFTTKARGLGLGLTVVKNLVENNGGKVEVESEPGRGTAFTLVLPVAE